jgi:hypothetical protein
MKAPVWNREKAGRGSGLSICHPDSEDEGLSAGILAYSGAVGKGGDA